MNLVNRFRIKKGYSHAPKYSKDIMLDTTYHPHVYPFAKHLAQMFDCEYVIDFGCGTASKLVTLSPPFKIIGIDIGENIRFCQKSYPTHSWIECNLEEPEHLAFPEELLKKAILVCADVIEHLRNPLPLLQKLKNFLDYSPVCILTTPERDLVRGANDLGHPANPHHVREWNMSELHNLLSFVGFNIEFMGLTASDTKSLKKNTIIAILGKNADNVSKQQDSAPDNFSIVAIMAVYNEADIIIPTIEKLVNEGILIYVIDNWSTDGTYELVRNMVGKGVIGLERFPSSGPTPYYEWAKILGRKEELARELDADWFTHFDADEVRKAPWQGMRLKDAIWKVDQLGYNAIDFTVVEFHPTNENFEPGSDFERTFLYWEFSRKPGNFVQIKAWKNCGVPVLLSESGGHEAVFEGRRVYPYKFLLKHYPIRGQSHGEKKVFRERKARYFVDELVAGWHTHYNSVRKKYCFLRDPSELQFWDESSFYKEFLVERLSGIGIPQESKSTMKRLIDDFIEYLSKIEILRELMVTIRKVRFRLAKRLFYKMDTD